MAGMAAVAGACSSSMSAGSGTQPGGVSVPPATPVVQFSIKPANGHRRVPPGKTVMWSGRIVRSAGSVCGAATGWVGGALEGAGEGTVAPVAETAGTGAGADEAGPAAVGRVLVVQAAARATRAVAPRIRAG